MESFFGACLVLGVLAASYFFISQKGKLGLSAIYGKHFFSTTPSIGINIFRFLYCSCLIYSVYMEGYQLKSGTFTPLRLFKFFNIPLLTEFEYFMLFVVLIIALVFSAIGFYTRMSLAISSLCFFIYHGTILSFQKSVFSNYVIHSENIAVFILTILSIAPGIATYSLDKLRDLRHQVLMIPNWPVQLIKLTIGLAYFGAGYSKVISSPLWVDGYTLQAYLLDKYLLLDIPWAYWLAQQYWLCVALSLFTVFLELTFFLVVFFPRLTRIYVLAGLGFHFGTLFVMGVNFIKVFLLSYLVFVEWPFKLGAKTSGPKTNINFINSILLKRNISAAIVSFFSLVLVSCIIFHIQAWPLSGYGVFPLRSHFSKVKVYRLQGRDRQGQLFWLPANYLNATPTAVYRLVTKSIDIVSLSDLEAIVKPYLKTENLNFLNKTSKIILLRRQIIFHTNAASEIIDTPILEFDL